MGPPEPGPVRFLYVGVGDTSEALAFYVDHLGARLRWRFQRFGADVAGVELGQGPLVLLADHRPAGSILPIWTVDDLAALQARLESRGLVFAGPEGTPEGDVLVVEVPGAGDRPGHQLAFIQVERPDAMDRAYVDQANTFRVVPPTDSTGPTGTP
jgi:catechol 2,3-dioxygenase-like lactoylglutathione lyase family enzyme